MTDNKRNRIIATASTIAVHVVIAIILLCLTLSYSPTPPQEESGVYIQLGTIDEANGTFKPYYPTPAISQVGNESTPSEEQLITQDVEESVAIEDNTALDEEQPDKVQKDNRVGSMVQGAFSGAEQTGGSGEGTQGDGAQGSTEGRPSGSVTGVAGGNRANLHGRTSLDIPHPIYNSNIEGTVVVNITVNKEGKVINANADIRKSTPDLSLREAAVNAALKARFSSTTREGNQTGTITYHFKQK